MTVIASMLPNLTNVSLWDDKAISMQEVLLNEATPFENINNTLAMLKDILAKGSLAKFTKNNKARRVNSRDDCSSPSSISSFSTEDDRSEGSASWESALRDFAADVQPHVVQLRNSIRTAGRSTLSLQELAIRCKPSSTLAKKPKYRVLGCVDSVASAYIAMMVLAWLHEIRNDEGIWLMVLEIMQRQFVSNSSAHGEIILTHAAVLTAVWVYGSDCRIAKYKLNKNYLLNALSVIFRTPLVSFKAGGKGSIAMQDVDSYLKSISENCHISSLLETISREESRMMDFGGAMLDSLGVRGDVGLTTLYDVFSRDSDFGMEFESIVVPPVESNLHLVSSTQEEIYVKVEIKTEAVMPVDYCSEVDAKVEVDDIEIKIEKKRKREWLDEISC